MVSQLQVSYNFILIAVTVQVLKISLFIRRTSYLSLNSSLHELLGNFCLLGLTGTATQQVQRAVCEMLNLDSDAIIEKNRFRANLKLSVSKLDEGNNR
jgi:superfamily II DNA helicase RecQ